MESLGSTNVHATPQLVWYITGASSGLGNHLVHALLARNEKVIATARNLEKLKDFPESDNLRVQQLDVTDGPEVLKQKAQEADAFFGRIDVLVNNAGIGSKAFIEEGGSAYFKEQCQTNVFGLLDVTTAVLPYMRQRKSGTVVMLGSRSSWQPDNPVTGLYSSSKAAVRVLSETLSVELKHLGIRVLIVEPGAFRTENIFAQPFYDGNEIADYDEQRAMMKKRFEEVAGKQPGDPRKGMELLADVVRGEGRAAGKPWPLYLPLGEEAEQAIKDKCKRMTDVLDTWGEIIRDTRLDNP